MIKWTKGSAVTAALTVVALVLPLSNVAFAEKFEQDVEFASEHPCTREFVEGDTWVKMWIETTNNSDGTMTVKIKQLTHGQELYGVISGDKYVFNDGQDTEETFTLLGPTGTVATRTTFIHTGEDQAFAEVPGLDDFHQRFLVTFAPLLPPTIVRDTAECK